MKHDYRRNIYISAAFAIGLNTSGCVYTSLSSSTHAELYRWDDSGLTLVASRNVMEDRESNRYFNFSDILIKDKTLEQLGDAPYVFRSCDVAVCHEIVLFHDNVEEGPHNLLIGGFAASGLSTAMYREVADLDPADARQALNELAAQLLREPGLDNHYTEFVQLDLSAAQDNAKLKSVAWESYAQEAISSGEEMSINQIVRSSVTATRDLSSDADFTFSTAQNIFLDIDVSERMTDNVHLSVCGDFQKSGIGYLVNYADCQLKVMMLDGSYQGSLRQSQAGGELLITLLPVSSPEDIEYFLWDSAVENIFSVR